ncbi:short chain dehydrogenase [Klebsiella grimontii]|nr:short chain dehydrogenase [Klebsiella grimontii]
MHYQPQRHLLQDRIILVTGASDGIGREAALTYSRYSASVILVGRNEEKLRSVAHEIQQAGGIPARWFTLDLLTCTPQECQQLAQKIAIHYPRLDGVLHNAGLLGDVCPMDRQKPEVWQQVMQVNVNGTFCSPRRCFLYYLNPNRVRWSLPPPASAVRGAPTGALMPHLNSPPKA